MRILVTGKGGNAGSWQIRGEQLGAAIGAEVMPLAEMAEIRSADLVVVVKRTPREVIRKIRAAGKPWVLDIVDGWPQPYGNEWKPVEALRWLQAFVADLGPTGIVFPTHQMREDSNFRGPALILPHHAWPKYQARPVAERVERVGYEGAASYLGRWRNALLAACAARGWQFVENGDLASCQIGVALRGVRGYPCGAWKANTKLANLQALGLPAIISPEMGYRETGTGREFEVLTTADLDHALDTLQDYSLRCAISESAQRHAPRLDQVARVYRQWLCGSKYF